MTPARVPHCCKSLAASSETDRLSSWQCLTMLLQNIFATASNPSTVCWRASVNKRPWVERARAQRRALPSPTHNLKQSAAQAVLEIEQRVPPTEPDFWDILILTLQQSTQWSSNFHGSVFSLSAESSHFLNDAVSGDVSLMCYLSGTKQQRAGNETAAAR